MSIYVPKNIAFPWLYRIGYRAAVSGKRDTDIRYSYTAGYLAGLRKRHSIVVRYDSLDGVWTVSIKYDDKPFKGWTVYDHKEHHKNRPEALAAANALAERLEGEAK